VPQPIPKSYWWLGNLGKLVSHMKNGMVKPWVCSLSASSRFQRPPKAQVSILSIITMLKRSVFSNTNWWNHKTRYLEDLVAKMMRKELKCSAYQDPRSPIYGLDSQPLVLVPKITLTPIVPSQFKSQCNSNSWGSPRYAAINHKCFSDFKIYHNTGFINRPLYANGAYKVS